MPNTVQTIWCRSFQAVLKVGNYFMGYRMPTYLEGPGKVREVGAFLREKQINDVLVVTGSGGLYSFAFPSILRIRRTTPFHSLYGSERITFHLSPLYSRSRSP